MNRRGFFGRMIGGAAAVASLPLVKAAEAATEAVEPVLPKPEPVTLAPKPDPSMSWMTSTSEPVRARLYQPPSSMGGYPIRIPSWASSLSTSLVGGPRYYSTATHYVMCSTISSSFW